ncbi:DUF4124 domain-containing protein [Paraferrimonas haliotis]|uniref:DUF4124 domain-containing protein n=2 Tax=Paraferrimonas haliotis TaxID=2013866 RepID=UPI000BA8E5B1
MMIFWSELVTLARNSKWKATMRNLIVLLLFFSFFSSATVYRWVDENGKVHYSDEPKEGTNAEQVQLKPNSSIQLSPPPSAADTATTETPAQPVEYKIAIVSPENQATIRENNGNFSVQVEVEPKLDSSLKMALSLNGNTYSVPQRTNLFRLVNIDRGEHKLSVRIIDQNGKVLASSQETTVYLHRASMLGGG